MAQALHRFDMRLRLGSIHDTSASKRQSEAAAAAKKHTPTSPTAKTESESKAEEAANAKAKAAAEEAAKPRHYRIRPLSESKAIESGANFISESFLFLVAGGLIVYESWRSRRKESTRREGVEGRLAELEQSEKTAVEGLVALEKELLALKAKQGEAIKSAPRILPRKMWEDEPEAEIAEGKESWWSRITSYFPGQSQSPTPSASVTQPAQKADSNPVANQETGKGSPSAGNSQPSASKRSQD